MCSYPPSTGEMEIGGFLWVTGEPGQLNLELQVQLETLSKIIRWARWKMTPDMNPLPIFTPPPPPHLCTHRYITGINLQEVD